MNGCGERTGNANLISIIANLQLKLGYRVPQPTSSSRTSPRRRTSSTRSSTSRPTPTSPTSGATRSRTRAACTPPASPPTRARSSTSTRRSSATSASSSCPSWAGGPACSRRPRTLGIELDDAAAARVIGRVKELEHEGYQFEAADGSLELLLRRETGDYEPLFRSSPGA